MLPRTYGCEELGQRGSELLRTPLPLTSVNKSKTTRSSLRRSELRLVLIPCPYVLGSRRHYRSADNGSAETDVVSLFDRWAFLISTYLTPWSRE
jgi:hypothetical protein